MYNLTLGFGLAYFGGGLGLIVYNDAKQQGKSRLVCLALSSIVAVVTSVLFTLIVTFVKI